MTVYNINLGIGWASSGVEYAQAYRSAMFKNRNIPAKFIFTDMFAYDNLSDLTRNLGFADEDIIWLYTFFSDIEVGPSTLALDDFENQIPYVITRREDFGNGIRLYCQEQEILYNVYFAHGSQNLVHRVELVSGGHLIRKDYYMDCKVFSEYYAPVDKTARLYQRRFFNRDGSVAYEEMIDQGESLFIFEDRFCYSKQELLAYMMERLALTDKDLVILDRSTGTAQAVFSHVQPAKLAVVVHAEHYSKNQVTPKTILWNNYYEYEFTHADKVDYFITATDQQRERLEAHFAKYTSMRPRILTIPVGSIDQLQVPGQERKSFSLMTASRLATEKHIDWLVKAVVVLRQALPEVTFDIYGKGSEEDKLRQIITDNQADSYIHLMGHRDLSQVYKDYEAYVTASKSEGFGLSLLEAVGSGLAVIGFDAPYGNQTFIHEGENGYLIPLPETDDEAKIVQAFVDKLTLYFTQGDKKAFHDHSYGLAEDYLTTKVDAQWQALVKEVESD